MGDRGGKVGETRATTRAHRPASRAGAVAFEKGERVPVLRAQFPRSHTIPHPAATRCPGARPPSALTSSHLASCACAPSKSKSTKRQCRKSVTGSRYSYASCPITRIRSFTWEGAFGGGAQGRRGRAVGQRAGAKGGKGGWRWRAVLPAWLLSRRGPRKAQRRACCTSPPPPPKQAPRGGALPCPAQHGAVCSACCSARRNKCAPRRARRAHHVAPPLVDDNSHRQVAQQVLAGELDGGDVPALAKGSGTRSFPKKNI